VKREKSEGSGSTNKEYTVRGVHAVRLSAAAAADWPPR